MSSYFQVRLTEVGASATRLLLHDSRLDTPRLITPTLMPSLNESGAFSCSVAKGHRGYDQIRERTSYLDIYQDGADAALWSGRVSGITDITTGLRQYSCEGALSFLADSVQPLWQHNGTCQALIDKILGYHNAQVDNNRKIYRGVVDSTLDPNNLIVREQGTVPYPNTFTKLKDATFGSSTGGYVRVRRASDSLLYLDWTKLPGGLNSQQIRFGDNLVDFQQATTGTSIITACEPFGADIEQETGDPIPLALDSTIPGATLLYTGPDGVGHYGFRDQETAALYGQVSTSQRWENVTQPANLLQRAADYVAAHKLVSLSFTAAAVDKHLISDASAFRVGDQVRVVVPPIGADQILTVQKMTIALDRPDGWQINLGADKRRTFLDTINQAQRTADQINEVVSSNVKLNEAITEVRVVADGAASAATKAETDAQVAQSQAAASAAAAQAAQAEADAAAQEAAAAAGIADGKPDILIQSATPTEAYQRSNTLWIDTTGGRNTPKRWSGSAWVAVTDKTAADAAAAAAAAQSTATAAGTNASAAADAAAAAQATANSKGDVLIQATAPAAAMQKATTLWIDTTGGANTPKRWSGSAWVVVSDKAATDAAAAASAAQATAATAAANAAAAQTTANTAVSNASSAASAAAAAQAKANQAFTDAAAAAGIANGKGDVLIQATAPAAALQKATTLWIDTTGGVNTPKRWSGSAWVAVTDKTAVDAASAAANAASAASTAQSAAATAQARADKAVADAAAAQTTANTANTAAGAAQATANQAQSAASAAASAAAAAQTTANTAVSNASSAASAAAAAQAKANQAFTDAAAAAGIANGKGDVLIQATAPAAALQKATTLWIDTTGGVNTPKRWSGSAWVAVTDKTAVDAASAAASAASAASTAQSAAATAQARADKAVADAAAAQAKANQATADAAAAQSTANQATTLANNAQSAANAAQTAATKLAATALASYSWDGTMPLDGITWEGTDANRTKSVVATDGALRANALVSPVPSAAGNFWAHFRPGLMQIEQGILYEVTAVVRVPSQTPAATGTVFAGVDGVKCNANGTFNSWVNGSGSNSYASQHYFAASDSTVPRTSGLWTTFTGYFRQAGAGEGYVGGLRPDPMNPGRIHPAATHFWPHVLMAYNGKADLVQVSNVSVTAYPLSSAKLIQEARTAAQAAAQAAADAAAGAAADLAQSILTLTSLIEQTSSSLSTTIGQTYELKSAALSSYQQLQSTITQLSTSVTLNFATVNAITQAINDALVSQFATLNVWVRFSTSGLDMGRTDSPITMNLNNTQLSFIQNGNVVAYISNNQLVITDAWVQGKLRIGSTGSTANYVWEVGPDQHLTLQRR